MSKSGWNQVGNAGSIPAASTETPCFAGGFFMTHTFPPASVDVFEQMGRPVTRWQRSTGQAGW
jgi:hypothetical protein